MIIFNSLHNFFSNSTYYNISDVYNMIIISWRTGLCMLSAITLELPAAADCTTIGRAFNAESFGLGLSVTVTAFN